MTPPHDEPSVSLSPTVSMTVGVVGGQGGIGSLFVRLLSVAGVTVLISDRETALSNADLVARCDLTLVAVPLRLTPTVLAALAPLVRPDAALISLGSLMEPSLSAFDACRGEAALLHPLFGPRLPTLEGATLAMAMLRDGPRQRLLFAWLQGQGARLVETTPHQHDRTMAAAQALLHGSYAALAPLLLAALPGREPLLWASPTLRLQLALMSRILHQDAALYGDLLALNRYAPAALDAAIAQLTALREAATAGPDAVAALFTAARAALGAHGTDLATAGDRALGEG